MTGAGQRTVVDRLNFILRPQCSWGCLCNRTQGQINDHEGIQLKLPEFTKNGTGRKKFIVSQEEMNYKVKKELTYIPSQGEG